MDPAEHFSAGLMMASLYPALTVMAVLMPSLPVLLIVEFYFLIFSLYLSVSILRTGRSVRSIRLQIYGALMLIVVLMGEASIWVLAPSEASGFSVLLSKAIFYLLVGSTLISRELGVRRYGLLIVAGSVLVVFPAPATAALGLILLLVGCFGASRSLEKFRVDDLGGKSNQSLELAPKDHQ